MTYQVSLYSEIGPFANTFNNYVPTASVVLTVPTGQFQAGAKNNIKGNWAGPDLYINPVAGLDRDYLVFNLNTIIEDIAFNPNTETPLFTIVNNANCAGAVELMDNDTDPFPKQATNLNIGNHITVFGNGMGNAYGGAYQPGSANCMGAPACTLSLDSVRQVNITDCGAGNGMITFYASGNTGTTLYSIDNGNTWTSNNNFTNLAKDNYNLKVKDNLCEIAYTNNPISITEPNLSLTLNKAVPPTCTNSQDGMLEMTASGGLAAYQYSINNGANWANAGTFNNLGNGTYTILARGSDGSCLTSYASNPVVFSVQGINIQVAKTDVSCTNATKGSILINASGGANAFQYSIDGGNTWGNSNAFSDLDVGSYNIIVRNADGSCATNYLNNPLIISGNALNFSVDIKQPSCSGVSDGSITFNMTGSATNVEYSINNGTNWTMNPTFSNLSESSYQLKVRRQDGSCETAYNANPIVFQASPINITVSSNAGTCANEGSIAIAASGGSGSFQYSVDDGQNWQLGNTFSGLSEGNYRVKVRNSDSTCVATYANNPISIQDKQINITLSSNAPTCHDSQDGSINITASGGSGSYLYSINNGVNYTNSNSFTGLGNGNYTIKVENANGTCETTYAGNSIQFNTLPLNLTASYEAISCPNGANAFIELLGNGGIGVFQYSIDGKENWSPNTQYHNLGGGDYNLFIRNANGTCETAYANNPLNLDIDAISINIINEELPTCATSKDGRFAIQIIGGGNKQFNISIDGGQSFSANTSFENLDTGVYNIQAIIVGSDCIPLTKQVVFKNRISCTDDADQDGQIDLLEDLNRNGTVEDDDTDMDGIPNYQDTDDDNDGVLTKVEGQGPNNGDGNGDNQPDCLQSFVASIQDENGAFRTLEIKSDSCDKIQHFTIQSATIFSEADLNFDYPSQLNEIRIPCTGMVEVNLYYHNIADFGNMTYRKFGPLSPGGTTSVWYPFPATFSKDTIGGVVLGKVSFSLTDGEQGDATIKDGLIVDPGGVAMLTGSTIDTVQVNVSSGWVEMVCLDDEIQLLDKIGNTSVLFQGSGVAGATFAGDSCVELLPQVDFVGKDYVTVVFCDSLRPTLCDTTVFDITSTKPDTCVLHYILEHSMGTYFFSMISDTTWVDPLNAVISAQFTVRAPANTFILSNLQNSIPSVNFDAQSKTTHNGYDYYKIALQTLNSKDIPFVKGDTTRLFSFQNAGFCTSDSLYLIGKGSPVPTPSIGDEDLTSKMVVMGWGLQAVPTCVMGTGLPVCSITNPPTDTIELVMAYQDTIQACIDSVLQFANREGMASICKNGKALNVLVNNNDDCVTLQAPNNFSGRDTLCIIHCDSVLTNICDTTYLFVTVEEEVLPSCVLNFDLAYNDGTYLVSMTPDTTFPNTFFAGLTRSMDIAFRAPTGQLEIVNQINFNSGYEFRLKRKITNPSETPGFDYFLFGLKENNEPTLFLPYTKGVKVDLFTFQNFKCNTDSIALVGTGATFSAPTIAGELIQTNADVNGWTNGSIPVCVSNQPMVLCQPITDTLRVEIIKNTTKDTCLNNKLKLPTAIGSRQLCQTGANVNLSFLNGDSCVRLSPVTNFVGNDTICIIHCDATHTNFCDTTYLLIRVREENCDVAITNTVTTTPSCSQNNGAITVTATGSNLQYSINGGTNFQANNVFQNLLANSYQVIVRDSVRTNCADTVNVTLSGSSQAVIQSVNVTEPSVCGAFDGSIVVFATGGSNLRFSIDGGQNFSNFNAFANLGSGTYNVMVRNGDASCPVNYTGNPIVFCTPCQVDAGSDLSICSGATISLTTTGTGSNFTWSPSTGLSCTNCPNPEASPTSTTKYYVTNNTCNETDSILITVLPTVNADFTFMNNCLDLAANFADNSSSSGTITAWNWDFGDGTGTATTQNPSYIYANAGTYTVRLTTSTADNCTNTISKSVTVGSGISTTISLGDTICAGDCVNLLATGGTQYSWEPAAGLNATNIANPVACPTQTTTYRVTISNGANCSKVDSVTVMVEKPSIGVALTDLRDCNANDASLTIISSVLKGNLEFRINDNQAWQTSNVFNGLSAGNYNIAVRKINGTCITNYENNPVVINEKVGPTIAAINTTNPSGCNLSNGVIAIDATGANSLIYSIDGGTNWSTNASFSGLGQGNYTVQIAYADTSCISNSQTATLTSPVAPVITAVNANNATDCGANNGSIEITATGSNTLEYSINNGTNWSASNQFNNLADGIYTILIRYTNQTCTVAHTTTVTISSPQGATIHNVTSSNPTACGLTDGRIEINATGNSTLEYSINNGANWFASNEFNNLSGGSYNILVRYANQSCQVAYGNNPVVLTAPTAISINSVTATDPTACGANNGQIQINATGNNTLEYSINNGANWSSNNLFTNLAPATYTILVRYTNRTCTTTYGSPVTIMAPAPPVINSVNATNPTACDFNNGSIQINASGSSTLEYSIDNGASWFAGSRFNHLGAGTYILLVRYTNQVCAAGYTAVINLVAPTPPTINNVVFSSPLNCGANNGSIQITATGSRPLEYSINNGNEWSDNPLFTNLPAGNYSVLVRYDNQTCEVAYNQAVVLTNPSLPGINTVNIVHPSSCGINDGNIEILATGNNLEYSIDDGQSWSNNPLFTNLQKGTYVVKVRLGICEVTYDANPIILTAPDNFAVTNPIPSQTTCADTSLAFSINLNEAIANYTINSGNIINPVINGNTFTFNALVTDIINEYAITFTNTAGCQTTEEFVIYKAKNTEAKFVVVEPFCKALETKLLFTGTASPQAILNWELDGGVLLTSSAATVNQAAGSEIMVRWDTEGSKLIRLTVNDGGCIDEELESIFVRKLPLVDAGADTTICRAECVQLEATGTAVWYNWSPTTGLNASDIPNPIACPTQTTTYVVTAMGPDGCVAIDSVTIFVESSLSVSATDPIICPGESTQLHVTGGTTYLWSPTASLNDPTSANPIANPSVTTVYTVTSVNEKGCQLIENIVIMVDTLPKPIACADKTICKGDSIQLIVTTHAQYAWSPANTLIDANTGTPTAFPTETTTYIVTVTDENGCSNTDDVIVFVNEANANAGPDQTICIGETAQLNATGGTTYRWSPSTGLNNINIANPLATPSVTTTYEVTVTDANGCEASDQVTVFVNTGTSITASADATICDGESIQLNVTGGTNYTWTPSTGLSNANIANPIANPTSTTTYIVNSLANGCPASDTVIIRVLPKPEAVACADKTICRGDSIQLIVTTHAQYAWSPSNTLIDAHTGTPIAFPTETTTYTVTVTDENGCTDIDDVVVFVNNPATINLGPDIQLCEAGPVTLDAGPGIAYQWTPTTGLSNPSIRNPIATINSNITYKVEVTTIDGCSGEDEIAITIGGSKVDAGGNIVLCPGTSGQLNASGAVSYVWSPTTGLSNPNIANPTVNVSEVTTYTVTGTDANGCTSTDEVTVIVSLPISVNPTITPAGCCGKGGSVVLNVSGGYGNTTYNWVPNVSNTNSASNLDAGFYKVIISDSEGCSNVFTFEIGKNCEKCVDIFPEREQCMNDSALIDSVCIPIPISDIHKYQVLVDGQEYTPDHGCSFDNLIAYSYALVEGQGSTGRYQIESWTINGQTYATEVENMVELVQWMNAIDQGGNWENNPALLTIIGGNPNKTYGNINLRHIANGSISTLQPNIRAVAVTSLVEIHRDNGVQEHEIIVIDRMTCCADTLLLKDCLDAPCEEEIITAKVFTEEVSCGEQAEICINLPFDLIANYELEANGQAFTGKMAACEFDSMYAYSYFTLANHGNAGPYRINSWLINGQVNAGMFNTLEELVALMNQIDVNGAWKLDAKTLTIQGGNPAMVYGQMQILQINTGAIANLDINANFIPKGTLLAFDNGNHDVIITNKTTGCKDRFLVNISCARDTTTNPVDTTTNPIDTTTNPIDTTTNPVDTTTNPIDTTKDITCVDFLAATQLTETIQQCDALASFCIDIPFDSINKYAIILGDSTYQGNLSACNTGTNIQMGIGTTTLIFNHIERNCSDTITLIVNCQTAAREETITIEVGEMGNYCPEPDDLIGAIISIQNSCPTEAGDLVTLRLDDTTYCVDYTGIEVGEERACLVLCDSNGICDTTYLTIKVVPAAPVEKPIAVKDIDSTMINTSIKIDVLANDTLFGNAQNITVIEKPRNGSATFDADNILNYTPNASYCDAADPDILMYGICNESGCDTAIVEIWVQCTQLKIMTGFSPNDDGVNDFFMVEGIEAFPNNEVKIFNRWGNLVFEQKAYKNRWKGDFKGKLLPDGTYFYLLKDGQGKTYSGYVQINR
jgi:gliding motility-associated-like protein